MSRDNDLRLAAIDAHTTLHASVKVLKDYIEHLETENSELRYGYEAALFDLQRIDEALDRDDPRRDLVAGPPAQLNDHPHLSECGLLNDVDHCTCLAYDTF